MNNLETIPKQHNVVTTDHSYVEAMQRFSRRETAAGYPSQFRRGNRRDEAERHAILRALRHLPRGSKVLDLPCGSGRLITLLQQQGMQVTGADASEEMLSNAAENLQHGQPVPLLYADVMRTGFADGEFDAVLCNRLFHHFHASETRRSALAELRRICRGPLIISFFSSFSVSAQWRRLQNGLRGKVKIDRQPIARSVFEADLLAQGLRPLEWIATRWGRSPHWYVVAVRDD